MFLRYLSILTLASIPLCSISEAQSLKGKKILVTTPNGYAQRMIAAFDGTGAKIVSQPMVETIIPAKNKPLASLIKNLPSYNWVAFSSRKAIQAFALTVKNVDQRKICFSKTKFCAMGKDVEYLKSELGIDPALSLPKPSPAGIVEALKQLPETNDQTIAVLAPEVREIPEPNVVPNFIRDLKEIGMQVTRINVYTTQPTTIKKKAQLIKNIFDRRYDVIAFTSTAEIQAFLRLIYPRTLSPLQKIACFGPVTAGNAKEMNLKVDIVATDYSSFNGFAKAMERYFTPM